MSHEHKSTAVFLLILYGILANTIYLIKIHMTSLLYFVIYLVICLKDTWQDIRPTSRYLKLQIFWKITIWEK